MDAEKNIAPDREPALFGDQGIHGPQGARFDEEIKVVTTRSPIA
jgi:hypothetical protein